MNKTSKARKGAEPRSLERRNQLHGRSKIELLGGTAGEKGNCKTMERGKETKALLERETRTLEVGVLDEGLGRWQRGGGS